MNRLTLTDTHCPPLMLGCDGTLIRPDQMRLLRPLVVELKPGLWVKIPAGFVTDFFSVPGWLKSLFTQFDNNSNVASLLHDYLYENWEVVCDQHVGLREIENPRLWCDTVFCELLYRFRPNRTSRLMYYAVRIGGGGNWKRFRSKNQLTNQ